MKCPKPKCGYEWTPRCDTPKACPRCKQYLPRDDQRTKITFPPKFDNDQTHWAVGSPYAPNADPMLIPVDEGRVIVPIDET